MVQDVEEIRADLQLVPLEHRNRLVDVQVGIEVARPAERVARNVAQSCWLVLVPNCDGEWHETLGVVQLE